MEIRPIHNERDYKNAFRMVSGLVHARLLALHKAEHSTLELPESDAGGVAQAR
jgi:antitoxin component HigA of HigAB toxin-antitoxin module